MAWTKLAIINAALSEIGLGGIIYDAMPEDRDHALARLDALMANWKAKGINVQYLVVDNPDFDTINGNAGIPADLVRAVILNLAVDIAPSFGKVALPHTTTAARAAYDDALGSDLTPPIASYTLRAAPAGAGWKRDPYSILIPGGDPEAVPDVPVVPVDVDVTAGLTVTDEARVGQFVNDFARGQPVVIASTFLGLDGTGGGMIWEIGGGVAGAYAGFRENGTFILRAGNGAAPWSDETAYIGIPAGVIAGDGMLVCELVPNLPEVSVNVWWKGELVGSAESFAPYAIWAGADPGTYLFPVQEGDTAPVGEVSDRAATYTTATNLLIYGGQRITAATVPTAPLNLAATAGNRLVSLTWDAPADDGGLPVTSYLIERNVAGAGWLPLIQVAFVNGAPLAYDDATVSNGVTYEYRVSAINGEGTGPASNVASAVPVAVPSAPQNLTATAGNTQATLDWQAPASDGGLAITGYQIERNDGAGWFVLGTVGDVLTFIDTGLTNGATYQYRVSAINSAGTGPASNVATVAIVTAPTAPQNLSATAGNNLVGLSWDAPASDGGLPVELYLVERNAAGAGWLPLIQLVFGPGTPLTYDDATVSNGVTYEYRVSATNDIGTSPPSNVVSATPVNSGVTGLTIVDPDFADYPMVVEKSDLTTTNVPVSGTFTGATPTTLEFRVVTDVFTEALPWTPLSVTTSGNDWSASIAMTSGTGRYLAQVRSGGFSAAQTVPFRTAGLVTMYGQSNALLFNDTQTSGITPDSAAFSFDAHQNYPYGPPRGDGSTRLLNELIAETGISWTIVVGGQGGSPISAIQAGTTPADNFLAELQKIDKKPFYYIFHQGEGDAPSANGRAYSTYRDPFRSIVDAVNALYPDQTGQTMDVLIQSLGTFLQDPPLQNAGWATVDGWHKQLVVDFADTHWAGSWRDMRHITGTEIDPYHGNGQDYERRAVRAFETIKALRGIVPSFETFRIDTATRIDATTTDMTVIHGQGTGMTIAGIVFGQEALDPAITQAVGFEISDGGAFQQATGVITGPNTVRWTHPAIATFGCTYRYLYGQTIPTPVGLLLDNSSATVPLLHEEVAKPVIDGAGPTGATFAQHAFSEPASGPNHTFTPTLTLAGATRWLYTIQILSDRNMTMTVNGQAATLLGSFIAPVSDGNGNPTGNVSELFVFETDQIGEVSISVSGGNYNASSYEFTITEAAGVTGAWSVLDDVFRLPASATDNTITHAPLTIPAGDVVSGVAIGRANPGDVSQYVSINFESYSGSFGSAQAIVATALSDGTEKTYQIVLTNNLTRMGSIITTISAA